MHDFHDIQFLSQGFMFLDLTATRVATMLMMGHCWPALKYNWPLAVFIETTCLAGREVNGKGASVV